MKICIVTGASGGLGKEFIHQLDHDSSFDEFWVIARSKEKLAQLQQTSSKVIRPIPLDLCDYNSIQKIISLLEKEKPDIRMLISNAGLGKIGECKELSLQDTNAMLDLNVKAAINITQACLPYMHKGARIIEIGSIAAFQPMPGFAVYGASKSFILSYTRALHYELLKEGIKVTCVCPYWIKDTNFIPCAKTTNKKGYTHTPFACLSSNVVKIALQANRLNLYVCTPGFIPTAQHFISKVVPQNIIIPFMDKVRKL